MKRILILFLLVSSVVLAGEAICKKSYFKKIFKDMRSFKSELNPLILEKEIKDCNLSLSDIGIKREDLSRLSFLMVQRKWIGGLNVSNYHPRGCRKIELLVERGFSYKELGISKEKISFFEKEFFIELAGKIYRGYIASGIKQGEKEKKLFLLRWALEYAYVKNKNRMPSLKDKKKLLKIFKINEKTYNNLIEKLLLVDIYQIKYEEIFRDYMIKNIL